MSFPDRNTIITTTTGSTAGIIVPPPQSPQISPFISSFTYASYGNEPKIIDIFPYRIIVHFGDNAFAEILICKKGRDPHNFENYTAIWCSCHSGWRKWRSFFIPKKVKEKARKALVKAELQK